MNKEDRLYQRENPNIDRSTKIIRTLLGNENHVDILSKNKDHPQNNHPLRVHARGAMQSLRPTETATAAELLLSEIGQAEYIKQIKAAQFLFSNVDFMKINPETLRNAFT